MKQTETCVVILNRLARWRGSFNEVPVLVGANDAFSGKWSDRGAPFAWVTTADRILARAIRKHKDIHGASHRTTR